MNTQGGALEFEFDIRLDRFEQQLNRVESDLRNVGNMAVAQGNQIEGAFKKIGGAIAAYLSIQTISSFANEIIKIRGEFQMLGVSLETILGNKQKADILMADIVKLSSTTPFTLQEVGSGAKQLIAFGENANTVIDTLRRLGDIASGTGANISELTAVYGKVMSKGRIQGEELNQLLEKGVSVKAFAEVLKVADKDVFKLVENGKVGFSDLKKVVDNLTNSGGAFNGMMAKQSKTIPGQISNMKDAWSQLFNQLGKSSEGYISGVVSGMTKIINSTTKLLEVSPVKQMEQEGLKVNILASNLLEANIPLDERRRLLTELKNISPDITKGLESENLNLTLLKGNLEAYNLQLANRILLQRKQDVIVDQAEKQADALEKQINREAELRAYLNNISQKGGASWVDQNKAKEYRKIIQSIITDSDLSLLGKAEKAQEAYYKAVGLNDNTLGVMVGDWLLSNKNLEKERSKTQSLVDARKKLAKDLGIIEKEPAKSVSTGEGGTPEQIALLGHLREEIKKLNDERDKLSTKDAIARNDLLTESYKKQLEILEIGIARINDVKYLAKAPIDPESLRDSLLNKPADLSKNKYTGQYEVTNQLTKPTQSQLDSYNPKDVVLEGIMKSVRENDKRVLEEHLKALDRLDRMNMDQLKESLVWWKKYLQTSDLTDKQKEEALKSIDDLVSGINDKSIKNIEGISNAVKELGNIIGGDLGSAFQSIAGNFDKMHEGLLSLNKEGATFGEQLSGGMSIVDGLYSSVMKLGSVIADMTTSTFDLTAEQNYLNAELNKTLELFTKLGNNKGMGYFTDYQKTLKEGDKTINEDKNKIADYQKQIEEWRKIAKPAAWKLIFGGVGVAEDIAEYNKAQKEIGKLTAASKEAQANIDRIKEEQVKAEAEFKENLTSTTTNSIADSIVAGFKKGQSASEIFADNFENIMLNAVSGIFERKVWDKLMETNGFNDMLTNAMSDLTLTKDEKNALSVKYQEDLSGFETMWKDVSSIFTPTNPDNSNTSAAAGAVKSIQEDTANLLVGQANASRLILMDQKNLAMEGLQNLVKIEYNTRRTADNTKGMFDIMSNNQNAQTNLLRANGI